MARDWLGDLFRRWGRTPARPAARRHSLMAAERLEGRVVPAVNPTFAILGDPTPQAAAGGSAFQPGPGLVASPTEVAVSLTAADPAAAFAALMAAPGHPGFEPATTAPLLVTGSDGMYQVGLAAGTTPQQAIDWLAAQPGVTWASPNYGFQGDPRLYEPNDPLYATDPGQYFLKLTQANKAWDTTAGDKNLIVAVLDSGVWLDHPDLQNLWTNPAPTNGDVHGIFSAVLPTSPSYGNVSFADLHGTHVAGTIGATSDNKTGVASLAGGKGGQAGVQLMIIKDYGAGADPTNGLYGLAIARGLIYAVDHGAKIINQSQVSANFIDSAGTTDPVLKAAYDYVYAKGAIHVIAAGNDDTANTQNLQYTHGIVVAATDRNDVRADFSNYGSGVDVSAPGVAITSTWKANTEADELSYPNNAPTDYGTISGTSMATPVTSGVLALIWSAHPTWTRDQAVAQLLGTADAGPLYTNNPSYLNQLGTGRVNAYRGVTETLPPPKFGATPGLPAAGSKVTALPGFTLRTPLRLDPTAVDVGDPNTTPVNAANFELRGAGTDGQFYTPDDVLVPLTVNGGRGYRIGSDGLAFTFPALAAGQYRFTAFAAKLTDPFGQRLDGNGDGKGGDDFVRSFTAAPTVTGTVFEDYNRTGVADTNDVGAGGMTVYLDKNNNGSKDAGEPYTFAGLGGRYSFPTPQFPTIAPGTYTVRVAVPTGWAGSGSTPAGSPITLAAGDTVNGLNFGLARAGAIYGTTFNDPAETGQRAVAAPGVAGFTVVLDSNGNAVFDAPTKSLTTKANNPNRVDIPDNSAAGSPITISSGSGTVTNVQLTVTADCGLDTGNGIQPGYLFNLTLTLIGPDGTRVPLAGYLDNASSMVNTVLDPNADTFIRNGGGSLTGKFRPTGDLTVFNGLSPLGVWTLEGTDNQVNGAEPYYTSVSVIRNWSIQLTTTDGDQQRVTTPAGGFRFDAPAGKYGLLLGRQKGYALTAPAAGYATAVDSTAGTPAPTLFGLRADNVAPQLVAITPAATITNSTTLTYDVKFSEPVEGLTAANFTLDPASLAKSTITGLAAVAGSPGRYTLTVSDPGGYGTVLVRLPAATPALTDSALNPLVGVPAAADPVTVDTLRPTGTLARPADKQSFTSANWPGAVTGTAADAETGVRAVLVTILQEGTGLYFDGTSFSNPDPVPVAAKLAANGTGWSVPVPTGALAEDVYSLSEQVVDLAGNTLAAAITARFGIDNGPPAVTVRPTAGTLLNTNPVPFVLTFSESVTGDIAGGLTVTGGTLAGFSGSGTTYTALVRPANGASGPVGIALAAGAARDFAGNPAPAASATVTYDGTAPGVAAAAGFDGLASTSGNFPGAVTGTAADDLAGVAKVQVAVRRQVGGVDLFWSGSGFTATAPVYFDAAGTTAWSYSFPASNFPADGGYQFLLRATDAAGNQTVRPADVTIDNVAPVPAVAAPAAGALVNAGGFDRGGRRLGGTATDATSGAALTEVSVRRTADGAYFDGTAFAPAGAEVFVPAGGTPADWTLFGLTAAQLVDGQYTVRVRTTDRAGNVGTATSVFTYDNTAPQPTDLNPGNGVGYNAGGWPGALVGRLADSGDTSGVSVTLQRQSDGLYWNGSFFGSDAPVPLTARVGAGGFAYPFSKFAFAGDGEYTLTATATDFAGNQGTAGSVFSFDNTAPTSTVSGAAGALFSPSTLPGRFTGTAGDGLSGVGLVTVSLRQVARGLYFDGSGFNSPAEVKLAAALASPNGATTGWAFGVPAGALPADGQYLLSSYATDVAGNSQPFGTPFAFGFDATAPQAVVQADRGAVTNVAPLSFSVAFTQPVGDLQVAGLVVTNGSVLDVVRRSDSAFTVRVTPASDGAVGLSVTPAAARDAAGNPTGPAGPATGQYDRTAPTVQLTAPAGVLPLGSPVTVTATFSEPVAGFNASSVRVTNGTVLGVTGAGTTYQIQVQPAGPGGVSVAVTGAAVADAAGNTATSSTTLSRTSEDPRYAVAVGNVVRLYDNRNGLRSQFAPFGDGFTSSIRVASADFNGDGIPDVVAGTGPGVPTEVRVLDGRDGSLLFQMNPFEESFTGGVFVAAGDLTGDGVAELIVTPDEGGGPRVRVMDGKSFAQVADFFGIADSAFRGGARAAVGDINGDGTGDLVVAAGFGGGPRVAIFDGRTVSQGEGNLQRVVGDFFAYESTLTNGVYVSAGDLDGDGKAELVTAGGPGGGPRVTAFSGADLARGTLTRTADFFAGDPASRDGVRVAVKRMQTDGPASLVVGGGGTNTLRVYNGGGLSGANPTPAMDVDLLPGLPGGGVYVG